MTPKLIILTDPDEERKARLNQPRMIRAEVLRQVRATTSLSGSAQRELDQSSNGSVNGRKPTES
jgi:hypothetical protein